MDTSAIDLREMVAERLRGRADFLGIEVLTHKTADLINKIEKKIAELSIVAIVRIDRARELGAQTARPTYDVDFSVEIAERPLLNKTGRDAWSLAFTAVAELKLLDLRSPQLAALVQVPTSGEIEEVTPPGMPELLIVRAPFSARLTGTPRTTTN